ncbi:MAG: tryptophan-rich sensory protein [Bacteroidetes bacterium]|nr:tryptophan-rich sensory protein [Bacteroidota bacterium]
MSSNTLRNRPLLALVAFLALVLGVGFLIGTATAPDAWYAALNKPSFNPPNYVFGPVWSILYVAIAVAGWRTWARRTPGPALRIWIAALVLNWLWSPAFFTLHAPWIAAVIIALLLGAIVAFIRTTWKPDRVSAILFLPYLAWVSFAAILNVSVAILN